MRSRLVFFFWAPFSDFYPFCAKSAFSPDNALSRRMVLPRFQSNFLFFRPSRYFIWFSVSRSGKLTVFLLLPYDVYVRSPPLLLTRISPPLPRTSPQPLPSLLCAFFSRFVLNVFVLIYYGPQALPPCLDLCSPSGGFQVLPISLAVPVMPSPMVSSPCPVDPHCRGSVYSHRVVMIFLFVLESHGFHPSLQNDGQPVLSQVAQAIDLGLSWFSFN